VNKNLIGIGVAAAVLAAIFVFHGKRRVPMDTFTLPPVTQVAPPVIETPAVAAPAVHPIKRHVQRKLKPHARVKVPAAPCNNSWHPERCNDPPECRGVFGCLN
jgi:hypothetical protein